MESNQPHSQFLVFHLREHEYALPVEVIVEVLRMVAIIPVPEAAVWLPGVINLRGRVIPVIDLRVRLGLPARPYNLSTPIIIAEIYNNAMGLIVDSVEEVLPIPTESIVPPDELTGEKHAVTAIARLTEHMVLIFDLEQLSAGSETVVTELNESRYAPHKSDSIEP